MDITLHKLLEYEILLSKIRFFIKILKERAYRIEYFIKCKLQDRLNYVIVKFYIILPADITQQQIIMFYID